MPLPSIAHLIYIPVILLVGIAIGFRLGASAARDELARRAKEKKR